MDLELEGKHVFITGASGGIGFETTKHFLKEGANVTACYHRYSRELTTLVAENAEQLCIIQGDVRVEEEVMNLFARAQEKFGRVDVVVANAGIANPQGVPVHEMPIEQWDNTMAVNLRGVFLCAKHFFKNLKDYPSNGAALILVGSTAGLFGEAWYCDYAASKAALHGLMMSLKNEIPHLAILGRVNLVNPGWTMTPMAEGALKDETMLERIITTIPLRKVATPRDIANAIVFLSSDAVANHISGQTITVAGGMEGRILFSSDELTSFLS